MWPLAGLMQLYYVSPLLWSTLRQGWDAAMLLPLACNVLSLALIAERRSRHLAKLLVVAVVLRTIGPELNPALVILTAYLARWRPLSQALLSGTAALLACAGEGFRGNWNQPVIVQVTLLALGIVTATAVGHGIQQREKTLAAEAAREEAARRADEARLEQVRLAERERIAREMHDVVAHRISLVAMASGALAYRDNMTPTEIREAAQLINDNAKRSLNELRLVLGTLRDSGSAPAPPQAGIEQVPILVAEARQAGQHIGLDVQADLAEVPSQTDDYVLRALKAGARGFLLKDTSPAEMLDAIRRAAAGEPVLSPQVAGQVIAAATAQERVDTAAKQNLDSLTTRERDVARLLAEGKSNQDIAHELYMSLATVKANITRIFLKLEVDNRVAAAMRIRDGGGIPKD